MGVARIKIERDGRVGTVIVEAETQEEAEAMVARQFAPDSTAGVREGMEPYGYQEKMRDFVTDTYPGRMLTEGAIGAGLGAFGGPVGAVLGGIGGAAGGAADKWAEDQGAGLGGRFAVAGAADLVATVLAGKAGVARGVAKVFGLRALPSKAQALKMLEDLPLNEGDGADAIMKALVERYPELRAIETEAYEAITDMAHGGYMADFDPVSDVARSGKNTLDIGGATPAVMSNAAAMGEGAEIPFEQLDRYRRMINQGRKTAARAGEGETLGELGAMRQGVTDAYNRPRRSTTTRSSWTQLMRLSRRPHTSMKPSPKRGLSSRARAYTPMSR